MTLLKELTETTYVPEREVAFVLRYPSGAYVDKGGRYCKTLLQARLWRDERKAQEVAANPHGHIYRRPEDMDGEMTVHKVTLEVN